MSITEGNAPAPAPAPQPAPAPAPAPSPEPAPQPAPSPTPAPQPAPAPAPAPAPQPAPAPEPAPAPTPAETKWRDGIADPALKNIAERIASPTDAVKIIQDLRTQNSKMIKPPDANATPEEKAKWLKAIGVPETPTGDTGYKITPPDGITLTDADTGLIDAILPVAHENQVPAAALNGFIGELLKKSRAMEAETVKAITDYGNAQEAALKKEWGNDYEANCNLAKRVVDVVGGDGLKAVFNTVKVEGGGLLGDHPDLMRFLANLGRRMDEGDLMIGSTKEERATVQQEIEALNKAVPIGSAGYSDKAHQAKLQSLYDKLYGNQVIVGGQNRAA